MATTRERVREHRRRLREQGLRPVQIWVPDVRAPEFVAEAHRQSAAVAASEHEADDQAFVDAISVDWDEAEPVFAKVREELAEAEAVCSDHVKLEEEIGDVLFSVVNLARKLKIDAEPALHRATEKFSRRFRAVEALARERGLVLDGMSLAELDALWDEVKAR